MREAAGAAGLRLPVALARAGVASRRRAAEIVAEGRVRVNGAVVRDPAVRGAPRRR